MHHIKEGEQMSLEPSQCPLRLPFEQFPLLGLPSGGNYLF